MVKHLFVLITFVLAFVILIIFLLIRNHKDRKSLFKKLPGDYPDPKEVESEFDTED
jgi:preprotein translocase subunit YajC